MTFVSKMMTFHDLTCVLEALQEAKCPILVYDGLTATGKKAVFVAVFFWVAGCFGKVWIIIFRFNAAATCWFMGV